MANENINFGGALQAFDLTATVSGGQVTNTVNQLLNFLFGATAHFYDAFFQAPSGGLAVPLPLATVFVALIWNRSLISGQFITVNWTPVSGSAQNFVLQPGSLTSPGGAFLYFQPTTSAGGGITSITLTGNGTTVPATVLVAG